VCHLDLTPSGLQTGATDDHFYIVAASIVKGRGNEIVVWQMPRIGLPGSGKLEASSPILNPVTHGDSTLQRIVSIIWAFAGITVMVGVVAWMMHDSISLPFIVRVRYIQGVNKA
jgi:hypothetical protein